MVLQNHSFGSIIFRFHDLDLRGDAAHKRLNWGDAQHEAQRDNSEEILRKSLNLTEPCVYRRKILRTHLFNWLYREGR